MNTRIAALALATLGGVAGLLASGTSHAANVGYFGLCYPGTPADQITAAGQTPVAIATANAASLAGISILVAEPCGSLTDPGVAATVSNGMILIVHDPSYSNASFLPGSPNLSNARSSLYAVDFEPGTPFLTGPGGVLTNTSLDNGGSSTHGDVTRASLPANSTVYATTGDTNKIIAFAYPYGAGMVYYSTIPLQCYLGSRCAAVSTAPANKTYATNLIAWAAGYAAPTTTCASEGYTGTKLTWCQNICEKGYTGATLDTWIHRWVNRYRDLPYCGQEGGGVEGPPQET